MSGGMTPAASRGTIASMSLLPLLRGSAIYTVATLVSRGLPFVLLPVYTRHLSPSVIGTIELLIVIEAVVRVVLSLELGQGLALYFSEATRRIEKVRYVSTSLSAILGLQILLVLALASSGGTIPAWLGSGVTTEHLFWIGGLLIVSQLTEFLLNVVRYDHRPGVYLLGTLAWGLGSAVGVWWFVVEQGQGLDGYLKAHTLGGALGALLLLVNVHAYLRPTFHLASLKRMLGFSLPLVASSVAMLGLAYVDRVVVRSHLGTAELGVYAVAFRIAMPVGLLLVGVQVALPPLVLRDHQSAETKHLLATTMRLLTLASCLMVLILATFSLPLVRLIAGEGYAAAAVLVPLAATTMVATRFQVFTIGLVVARRSMLIAAVNVAGTITTIVLAILLVQTAGILGAALASTASAVATLVVMMTLAQRSYRLELPLGRIAAMVVTTATGATALSMLSTEGTAWIWRSILLLCTAAACVALGLKRTRS